MTTYATYPSLSGVPVFITGGASGIGASLVRHFCQQRSRVAFVDIDTASGNALCAELRAETGNAPVFIACDLTDIPALRVAIEQARSHIGEVRVLVNNGANDQRHKLEDITVEYWDERMAVNLRHQFFTAQALIPGMRQAGGGSIINFGSISWKTRSGGMPVYTAAKAAVNGLTRSLARDYGCYNIRVNTVVPGWVMTERQRALWLDEEGNRTLDREQLLPGRVMPEDLARMVLFLAADDSRMCTGQEFTVDAGWT